MSNQGNIQLPAARQSVCQELEVDSSLPESWWCIDGAATNVSTIDFKRLVDRQSSSATSRARCF